MNTKTRAAGLLMFRRTSPQVEFFLVHAGGPLFKNKWDGYWSIPKGIIEEGEEPLETAIREFEEETGLAPQADDYIDLGTITQKSGKVVYAWAFEGDWPPDRPIRSNLFSLEWPPKSGNWQKFPEIDDGRFFDWDSALGKINERQRPLLERLMAHIESKR